MKTTFIILPAKNEAPRIGPVLQELKTLGFENIVVVDDGSSDRTKEIASSLQCTVLQHRINLGAGAATQTGVAYALSQNASTIVTMDADGQHSPKDIYKLVDALNAHQVDLVIGSRFKMASNEIPLTRLFYNRIGNIVSFLITGIWVSDSQSGMKAFTASFAEKVAIQFDGYEFCIELIRHARHHKASIREIPIEVTYTKETLRKGQSFISGLKMLAKLRRLF